MSLRFGPSSAKSIMRRKSHIGPTVNSGTFHSWNSEIAQSVDPTCGLPMLKRTNKKPSKAISTTATRSGHGISPGIGCAADSRVSMRHGKTHAHVAENCRAARVVLVLHACCKAVSAPLPAIALAARRISLSVAASRKRERSKNNQWFHGAWPGAIKGAAFTPVRVSFARVILP